MKVEIYALVGAVKKETAKQVYSPPDESQKKTKMAKQQDALMICVYDIIYTGWKSFGFYYIHILLPKKEIILDGFLKSICIY